jgi:threonine 3-dehydrogenase
MPSETMMAVVKTRREPGYDYMRVPRPQPRAMEVLLRVQKAAICGTDILLYQWTALAQSIVRGLPFIPGHECCAEVVEVGTDVRDIKPGDKVCAETHIPCGRCYQCTHGLQHICQNLVLFGHHVDGCFAEYAMIPASSVYRLKSGLEPHIACLLEPFGVSVRAVEEAAPQGDTLVVTGCGPIGLFAIAVARQAGATKIIAAEVNPFRLDLARKMGADVVVNVGEADLGKVVFDETDRQGAGRIIEASGNPNIVNSCFSYLRKGGTIVLVGNPKGPVEIRNVMTDLMHKELTLKTIHGRRMYETWEKAEALLANGDVDISQVITHTFPLTRIDEALRAILNGQACKVILETGE